MEFEIEDVVDVSEHDVQKVEVRARLADGRLSCVTLPKGDTQTYRVGVEAYLAEQATGPAEGTAV
jgi:hypothetical protein